MGTQKDKKRIISWASPLSLREAEGAKDQPVVDPAVRGLVEAAMKAEQEAGVSGSLYFKAMNDLATDGLDQDVIDRMIEKAKERGEYQEG